jgi:hypothetical protein
VEAPDHRLAERPLISGSSKPMAPAGVGIDHQLQPGARRSHRANVVRACSVKGPNRKTTVELLTGSYW